MNMSKEERREIKLRCLALTGGELNQAKALYEFVTEDEDA